MITVIIATFNRCRSLQKTLESLLNQKRPDNSRLDNYELLVVDNNSTDSTADLVSSFAEKFAGRLKYVSEPKQGKTFALNAGIKAANGTLLAFTDDDVVVDSEWLYQIEKMFAAYPADALGGRILPLYPDRAPRWVKDFKDLLSGPIVWHDYGAEIRIYDKRMNPFVGANMAVRKSVFAEMGLFRSDLGAGQGTMGDDSEFFERLSGAGKKLYYCGGALVRHPVDRARMNLFYVAKWKIAYGRYAVGLDDPAAAKGPVEYFGVPRYRFRQLAAAGRRTLASAFNRREFLINFMKFFILYGMVLQYIKARRDGGRRKSEISQVQT